jgi:hypothetical protein
MAGAVVASNIATYDLQHETWSSIGDGFDGPVLSISDQPSGFAELIACGDFVYSGSTVVNHIAAFSGDKWTPWGSALNNTAYALANFEIHIPHFQMGEGFPVFVGGTFTTAGGKPSHNLAIHYYPMFGSVSRDNENTNLIIIPNPVISRDIEIKVHQSRLSSIHLSIADALGRSVAVLANGETVRSKEYSFDAANLANGVYYCVLRTEDKTEVQKLIVSR